MRAIVYNHSSEEGIKEVELKPPKLLPKNRTHVLIKVYYCGVNPVDAKYNVGDKKRPRVRDEGMCVYV